jgi:tetratricopeptide (TPR) repeat protein
VPPAEAIQAPPGSAGAPGTDKGSERGTEEPVETAPPAAVVARLLAAPDGAARRALFERSIAARDPDALLKALKAESERLWHADPHGSLRAAEALIEGAKLAGCPDHGALGLMARADALRLLGRFPESLPQFEAAARAFLDQGDEVGWARTRIGWLCAMHMMGRAEKALPVAEAARDALVRHGELLRAAALDVNTAVVCHDLGQLLRSVALYDRALGVYSELGAGAELPSARARANKAIVLTQMGDFRAALSLFDSTREVWLRNGQDASLLRQDMLVAKVYIGQGRYTRALHLSEEIRAARERAGQPFDAASAALNMIECHLGLNRNAEAADLARDTIARFEGCGTPIEAARARIFASFALARLGETGEALSSLEAAAQTCQRSGLATYLALITLQRARLHLGNGQHEAARAAADEARALFASQGLALRCAEAETVASRAALGQGDLTEAANLARAALATSERCGAPWLAHEGHLVLARLARGAGRCREALSELDAAVASIEQVQSRLAPELRSHFLDDKVQVYREAIETALTAAGPERALGYLERAKSRALVDYLAANADVRLRPHRAASRGLLEELGRLRDEHNWLYDRLHRYGLVQASDEPLKPAEAAALQEAVRDREGRIARLLEQITLRDTGAVEGIAGAAPHSHGIPPLDDRTVLLEYFFHEDGGVAFAVSRGNVAAVPLTAGAAEVQRYLFRWQLSLDACARALVQGRPLAPLQRNALGVLQGLYGVLLAPLEAHLHDHDRLVIVPYGAGHAVPWHALHDGSRYLLQRAEIWACPSSSLLQLLSGRRRPGPGTAVVFAHTQGGLMGSIRQEAAAVAATLGAQVYEEASATVDALRSAAPGCKVLHLAAHGEARLDDPTFAHLQLADGQLTTADVFNLSLDGALVTLSACETGRTVVTGGDELIGLSRGFLFAGASALVQSLWRVEDGSTARLMACFYRELAEGRTAAQALRQAQLALMDGREDSPYFWAPFQVVGDGDWCLGRS